MNILNKLILILCGAFFAVGCDLYTQDDYEEKYVVESYLIANRNLPQVRISRTQPLQVEYRFENAAVNDANVEIRLLTETGSVEEVYNYSLQSDGVYVPVSSWTVLPSRSYELNVTFSGNNRVVTSTTFVPGQFEVVGDVVDSIDYQDPNQVVINTTNSIYPGRQTYFIFNVSVVSPDPENLTPFYADLVEEDEEISDFYKNSSGIINEENYERKPDGTLTLRVPWLAVAFYGDNYIIANAIDDNMYDFYRSQSVQSGGSTLPPGEYQNAIYNVDGGIGVFGSLASDTVRVFIND